MEVMMTYVQPFVDWLLQTTLIGSVVICLILAAQKTLGGKLGPRWCHALWLVLLIRMVLPWAPSSRISLLNLIPSWDRQVQRQQLSEATEQHEPSQAAQTSGATKATPVEKPEPDAVIQKESSEPETLANMQNEFQSRLVSLRGVLALLWLGGATVVGAYLLVSNFTLWRIVKRDRPLVNQAMLELFEKCKTQMGVQTLVAVVPSGQIRNPALFGFVRPRLLLPREMLEKASYEEMRYVFLHELDHLKRRDIYVGWLTSFLQVLHWFNPLVWFAFYRMRSDRELACDALVLTKMGQEKSQEYGGAIVGLLRRFSRSRPLPSMAGILENRSQLKRRIKMIAKFKKNSYQWSPLAVILIILLACVSLLDARRTKASETSAAKPPPGANIIWVTSTRDYDVDGVQDDQAWVDWLVAEGYNVDVRIDYWKELDATKADELNAADLVIMSRSTYSLDHDDDNETTLWNSVTTPLITMNCFLVHSDRWRWMNTTDWVRRDHIMLALDTTHPVFDGVTFEMGNMVTFLDNTVGSGKATFVGSIDVGNGTLIAQTLADFTWIAEWPAGVEFFAGSGQIAGGPRMLFVAGTQEIDGPPPTPWGAWNLTAEGEKMFRNAIAYMLPAAPEENIIWVTSTRDYDIDGVQDDQGFIDWLVAEGHNVDLRIDYWNELDLEPNKVDELNAADLVIMSRSTYSLDHDDGNEPTLWNSVTTPLITMSCFLVRSSRWRWMDTTTTPQGDYIMLALDPIHPVFDGVTFEMGNLVIFLDNTVGSGEASFVGSIDVGNGTLIAQTLADHTWIAEWPAGVEFYAGSGQTAAGPRMLFVAGTQEIDGLPPTPWGAFNLTANGEQMLRNAIAYMLPAAPEAPGPVAHWQLDEGSGTIAADSSGNGLDGTLVGDPLWVAGIIGGALNFDGVDDYVDCGNPSILDFGTSDFTVSAWIRTTDAGGETIFANGGDNSGGIRVRLFVEGNPGVKILVDDNITKYDPEGDIPVVDGQWHHIVGMRVGTALRVYIDGVEDQGATAHSESTIPADYDLSGTSQHNAYIGVVTNNETSQLQKFFAGTIDDVRIYDLALSEAEVAAIASGQ